MDERECGHPGEAMPRTQRGISLPCITIKWYFPNSDEPKVKRTSINNRYGVEPSASLLSGAYRGFGAFERCQVRGDLK